MVPKGSGRTSVWAGLRGAAEPWGRPELSTLVMAECASTAGRRGSTVLTHSSLIGSGFWEQLSYHLQTCPVIIKTLALANKDWKPNLHIYQLKGICHSFWPLESKPLYCMVNPPRRNVDPLSYCRSGKCQKLPVPTPLAAKAQTHDPGPT